MVIVKSTKLNEIDVSIVDFKNACTKEWYLQVITVALVLQYCRCIISLECEFTGFFQQPKTNF